MRRYVYAVPVLVCALAITAAEPRSREKRFVAAYQPLSLSVTEAIKLAKEFAKKQKVSLDFHYLKQASFTLEPDWGGARGVQGQWTLDYYAIMVSGHGKVHLIDKPSSVPIYRFSVRNDKKVILEIIKSELIRAGDKKKVGKGVAQ